MSTGVLIHSTKDADGQATAFHDALTYESVANFHPVTFYDDFLGAGATIPAAGSAVDGYAWVSKIVDTSGSPTVARVSNSSCGVVSCALDATSEAQTAALYWGDVLNIDVTKGAIFEARVAYDVLPSATGVIATFGLQSAYAAPGSVSYYVNFESNGSGLVNYQTKDGVNTVSTTTGITMSATGPAYHIFRIDCTNAAAIVFSIDGAIITSTAAFAATGSNAVLQPYFGLYKASGTGVGTLYVDYVKIAANRQ